MAPGTNDNEILWIPESELFKYPTHQHDRLLGVIEVLASFTGKKGDFSLKVTENGNELTFKMPIEEVFLECHHIFSYFKEKYGRSFGDDSTLINDWKRKKKNKLGKEKVLHIPLPFPCEKKFTHDFGFPRMVFAEINRIKDGDEISVPVLIVELRSIEKFEEEDDEQVLQKDIFTSPRSKERPAIMRMDVFEIMELINKLTDNPDVSVEDFMYHLRKDNIEPEDMEIDVVDLLKKTKNKKRKISE